MAREKKRLLVTLSYSFSIRYIYRSGLLHSLREFCDPVVAITWNQPDLILDLEQNGFEVHIVPESHRGVAYADLRKKIDIWFRHFKLTGNSGKIQEKYLNYVFPKKNTLIRNTRKWYNIVCFYLPGYTKKLFHREKSLLKTDTNYNELSAIIDKLNIDVVFTVTPFHRQEDILLRVCKDRGKQMLTSILSFDNITKRGWIPVEYDLYMVWNKDNKEQLYAIYPFTKKKPVHITGAVQFDFYTREEYLLAVEEWKYIVGLPTGNDKKIILYSGGPASTLPMETNYLKQIDEAINNGRIKNKPIVLFRCHPIDKMERWKKALGQSENIIFDHSWSGTENLGYSNITKSDIKKLCSTLAYTDLHVNICSTMTVDGCAFNKPQIGPAYVEGDTKGSFLLEQMYHQDHFKPIIQTNGISLAKSAEGLIALINSTLKNPENYTQYNTRILDRIVTFSDGKNKDRVAEIIRSFLLQS